MPYPPQHKAETRERIVTSARRLFNHKGFAEVSIDEIMTAAGLTRGGFYHHFQSKEELYAEAVLHVLRHPPPKSWNGVPFDPSAPAPVFSRQIVEAYLSRRHYADKDQQCPMVALPSDVARAGPGVRAAYRQLLEAMAGLFARGIRCNGREPRRSALALTALCVGGMVLARTVDDERLAGEILDAARELSLDIGGWSDAADPCRAEIVASERRPAN